MVQAVDIISDALKALGNAKPDIARALLELAVAVLAGGEVMRMLSAGQSSSQLTLVNQTYSSPPRPLRLYSKTSPLAPLGEQACSPCNTDVEQHQWNVTSGVLRGQFRHRKGQAP